MGEGGEWERGGPLGMERGEVGRGEGVEQCGQGAVRVEEMGEVEGVEQTVGECGQGVEGLAESGVGGLVAVPGGEGEGPEPFLAGDAAGGAIGEQVPGFFGEVEEDGTGVGGGGGMDADEVGVEEGPTLFEAAAELGGAGVARERAEVELTDDDEPGVVIEGGGAESVGEKDAGMSGLVGVATGDAEVANGSMRGG